MSSEALWVDVNDNENLKSKGEVSIKRDFGNQPPIYRSIIVVS
jgi:hypothetical protein